MFPFPTVTFLGSEIPLHCCVKVKSSGVISAIYFLPVKEEGILEQFCSALAQRIHLDIHLDNVYPGVPWIQSLALLFQSPDPGHGKAALLK